MASGVPEGNDASSSSVMEENFDEEISKFFEKMNEEDDLKRNMAGNTFRSGGVMENIMTGITFVTILQYWVATTGIAVTKLDLLLKLLHAVKPEINYKQLKKTGQGLMEVC